LPSFSCHVFSRQHAPPQCPRTRVWALSKEGQPSVFMIATISMHHFAFLSSCNMNSHLPYFFGEVLQATMCVFDLALFQCNKCSAAISKSNRPKWSIKVFSEAVTVWRHCSPGKVRATITTKESSRLGAFTLPSCHHHRQEVPVANHGGPGTSGAARSTKDVTRTKKGTPGAKRNKQSKTLK
jgi:hypothetical protein